LIDNGHLPEKPTGNGSVKIGLTKTDDVKVNINSKKDDEIDLSKPESTDSESSSETDDKPTE
jgi:cell division protease FtsH